MQTLAGSLVKISSMTQRSEVRALSLFRTRGGAILRPNDQKRVTAIPVAPMPSDTTTILDPNERTAMTVGCRGPGPRPPLHFPRATYQAAVGSFAP